MFVSNTYPIMYPTLFVVSNLCVSKAFKIGSKEYYLLSMKDLFLTAIPKPPEKSEQIHFLVSVSFFVFPCSKGHSVRAYLDTI